MESVHASSSPRDPVPLTTLQPGEWARVHDRQMGCDDCELLNAMGLTGQCRLRVCRSGRQCIVQVAATRLGLAGAVASRILVVREDDGLPVPR
jgi:Fe2+ transport system protein FeoA